MKHLNSLNKKIKQYGGASNTSESFVMVPKMSSFVIVDEDIPAHPLLHEVPIAPVSPYALRASPALRADHSISSAPYALRASPALRADHSISSAPSSVLGLGAEYRHAYGHRPAYEYRPAKVSLDADIPSSKSNIYKTAESSLINPVDLERIKKARKDILPGEISHDKLNQYNIIKTLGAGGFGAAYLVEKKSDKSKHIIKKIFLNNESLLISTFKEKYIPKMLELINNGCHPNITCLEEFFIVQNAEGKQAYLVYKYIEGKDLYQWLKMNKIGQPEFDRIFFREKLDIVRDLLSAYTFIKNIGVVHRDIKPSNVIITYMNRAVVIDFGLSCVNEINPYTKKWKELAKDDYINIKCKEGSSAGTPDYIAPELYQNEYKKLFVDYEHADRYSIGVTFQDIFPEYKTIPKLRGMIDKLLSFDPKQRPTLEECSTIVEDIISTVTL